MAGALDGIRVLDLTAMITGPFATQMLGDQGAEVVKVEPPLLGDLIRHLGTSRGGMSTMFALLNRNKRSVVLNLREKRGRELARRLAREADVFVQNFRPGVIERLELDHETLRAENPDLVYVSISAYGATGPYSHKPAFDHIIQGLAGIAWAQADPADTEPRPCFVRQAICDKVTAYTVAQGVTAALLARERGGGGQHLEVSMLDAALSFVWPDAMTNHVILDGEVEARPPIAATYRVNESSDGFVSVAPVTDAQFQGVARALGVPELIDDPRFATLAGRSENFLELIEILEANRPDATTAEALARLEAEDVPCGPVTRQQEVPRDPQVLENGSFLEGEHPQLGRIRQPRPPIRFAGTPAAVTRPAPPLGGDTAEVLAGLGLAADEIDSLREQGIVG